MFIRSVNVTDEAEPLNEPPTAILVIRLWVLFVVHHVLIVKLARFAELVELLIVHVVDRAVWAYPRVRDWRQRGVLHPRGFDCFEVGFFSCSRCFVVGFRRFRQTNRTNHSRTFSQKTGWP